MPYAQSILISHVQYADLSWQILYLLFRSNHVAKSWGFLLRSVVNSFNAINQSPTWQDKERNIKAEKAKGNGEEKHLHLSLSDVKKLHLSSSCPLPRSPPLPFLNSIHLLFIRHWVREGLQREVRWKAPRSACTFLWLYISDVGLLLCQRLCLAARGRASVNAENKGFLWEQTERGVCVCEASHCLDLEEMTELKTPQLGPFLWAVVRTKVSCIKNS